MRYCPHCHRFNPGKPLICHYCGRTWYVRLCQRGHENPAGALYCGTCGSTDLSETAGRRPWLLLTLKGLAWLLLGFLVCTIIIRVRAFLVGPHADSLMPLFVVSLMMLFGIWALFSFMPVPLKQGARRTGRYALKGMGWIIWEILRLIWKILR